MSLVRVCYRKCARIIQEVRKKVKQSREKKRDKNMYISEKEEERK